MAGASARRKGATWEGEVAHTHMKSIFGPSVRRGNQRADGSDEPDVVVPDEAELWIECQSSVWCDFRGKLAQALEAATRHALRFKKTKRPVAFLKDTHKGKPGTPARPAIVAMYLPDFLNLLEDWWRMKQGMNQGALAAPEELIARLEAVQATVGAAIKELKGASGESAKAKNDDFDP